MDDSKNHKLPVDIRFNNDRNLTYSVSYTPKSEGPHKVRVLYGGREIPKSPYTVMVDGQSGDPSKVTASGPGLQAEGLVVNRQTFFDIFTKDAGRGVPEVIILDPQVIEQKKINKNNIFQKFAIFNIKKFVFDRVLRQLFL